MVKGHQTVVYIGSVLFHFIIFLTKSKYIFCSRSITIIQYSSNGSDLINQSDNGKIIHGAPPSALFGRVEVTG